MRKSTAVTLGILVVALVSLTLLMKVYTDRFVEEIRHAKAMTAEFEADLAPGSKLKLARTRGGPSYVVKDDRPGLIVEAAPSEAVWRTDPQGMALARRLTLRLLSLYPPERPVQWAELRFERLDGSRQTAFAIDRTPAGTLVVVGSPR